MSILLQKKNVGDYSYMSSPNIYYRASILLQKKNVGDYSYMSSPNIYYRAYYKYNNTKKLFTPLWNE